MVMATLGSTIARYNREKLTQPHFARIKNINTKNMNVCKISIDLQCTLASLTYDSVTLTLVYKCKQGKI